MLPHKWIIFLGIGLLLFAIGSFGMYLAIENFRWSFTMSALGANFAVGFPMMAWGIVFATKGLRQMMSIYRIDKWIVTGAALVSASVVMASLAVFNHLQYLQVRAGLEKCNSEPVSFCGRFMPFIYYDDFVTFSIAGSILGVIGVALLIAGWRGGKSRRPMTVVGNDDGTH